MTPHEWAMKTVKDIEERKKKRELEADSYIAKRRAINKAIKHKTGELK